MIFMSGRGGAELAVVQFVQQLRFGLLFDLYLNISQKDLDANLTIKAVYPCYYLLTIRIPTRVLFSTINKDQ